MKTLYVSDLDGTLLTPEKEISKASADILNHLIQKGLLFTVATARSPATACEVLSNLKLELPGILLNGAVLYDFRRRRFAGSAPMSYEAASKALAVYRQAGGCHFSIRSRMMKSVFPMSGSVIRRRNGSARNGRAKPTSALSKENWFCPQRMSRFTLP